MREIAQLLGWSEAKVKIRAFRARHAMRRALERLTRDHLGRQLTIVLGGEVVTMHKIREVIKGGDVQISSCVAGAAGYLLEQLRAHQKHK